MDDKLRQLPFIADEMLHDVKAGPALKTQILNRAKKPAPIPFKPLRAIPALCAVLILVGASVVGLPRLLSANMDPAINSQPAGMTADPSINTRADLPEDSVTLRSGAPAPAYRTIWARATGSYFPLIQVDGNTYRMLTTPSNLSQKRLGSALGTVSTYTADPSAGGDGILSNVALADETVYAVSGMSGAMVAANVDGKMRVFQRVSFNGSATNGAETLDDTLKAGTVTELVLSDVGTVTDADKAQSLYNTLVGNASYQSADLKNTTQSLLIKTSTGLTLQLNVNGDTLAACGTWSCADFFEAFNAALE